MPRRDEVKVGRDGSLKASPKDHTRSDSSEGLDIVRTTRKRLQLNSSNDIEALVQTESFSEQDDDKNATKKHTGEAHVIGFSGQPHFRILDSVSKLPEKVTFIEASADSDDFSSLSDGDTKYSNWKNRGALKRTRATAEVNRIRAQTNSRKSAEFSIVGRKSKRIKAGEENAIFMAYPLSDVNDKETYLDEPIPDYIQTRKQGLRELHMAGLRYPPDYEGIDFSDSESEEKPMLDRYTKVQRVKAPLELQETAAMIPGPIAQWLRDYQVEGVNFLHDQFVRQTGAILGDDMGLGKTIQVISFLSAAFGKFGSKRDAKCMRKIRRCPDRRWYPKVLIVCPGTLMQNWEDELEKWGWWEVYKYHGNPADKKGILGAASKGMLEIMITTYETYRGNEGEINVIDWDCVIADECHQIKNKNAGITKAMNKINALCRIGLTGTAIQNKYEELWTLLNWARPGEYGSAQEWKQTISEPLRVGQAHGASYAQLADARSKAQELVHGILPSVFLRRMKTLIADQLPKKSDRVVFCQLTETQADAYRAFIESEKCKFIRTAREPCDCGSGKQRGWCCYVEVPEHGKWAHLMFPSMITLQKLANHLALLLPVSTDPPEKHNKDLDNLKTACPGDWQTLYRIRDSILHQSQRGYCGKWKVLKSLLDFWHANGDKVLVFSHSVRLLRLLRTLFNLDGTKYNFSYLDGSMRYEDRAAAVADFNSDPAQFVFLISTRAGGVGLNITSANKVVVVDPNWNPAYDLQAQDRAYRIGQTRDVEVFRLISAGTIEEIVYARQIYKQQQANIGYTASNERRYFKGVQDRSKQKGELFGLENLFTFQEDGLLLRDIMHKTNVAETRAGINAISCEFDENDIDSEDEDILSDKSLGIANDEMSMASQMKKVVEKFTSSTTKNGQEGKPTSHAAPDPIHAILAKAGVQYTHENSEVIGRSNVEARLSKQAMEFRNDIDFSRKRVFGASQSQLGVYFQDNDEYISEDENVHFLGRSEKGKDLAIDYKYRPSEGVRRRQFCEMARYNSFEDPTEFALVVESMTQKDRTKTLKKFYRRRRADVTKLSNQDG